MRPSQLLDVQDEYMAYCLDEAIAFVGSYITNELEKVEGKNSRQIEHKRQGVLRRLLTPRKDDGGKRFRSVDPALIQKMPSEPRPETLRETKEGQ